ncbi:N-acylneuraminate cytidylyltransferase-like [Scyliorhinus canicula]|uniref:N-acylneuraminate cytidylyltransferase-like n=1 Tax=Scyliorhinus canicula TaxID=7830 RepID=UPI0018F50B2D|nr:N-acylneuraminate cytidylyltransferase-like [Scyliorhinus canicula]
MICFVPADNLFSFLFSYGYFGKITEKVELLVCNLDADLKEGASTSQNGKFNMLDIPALKTLKDTGVEVTFFPETDTNRSKIKQSRTLNMEVNRNAKDKLKTLEGLRKKFNITWKNVAYLGNAESDIECMKKAQVRGAPQDAASPVLEVANYICKHNAGTRSVEEFAEHVLLLVKEFHKTNGHGKN